MKRIVLIALASAMICSIIGCTQSRNTLIRDCRPTEKTHAKVSEYSNYTVLTVDDLRHILIDDTEHYKIAVVYSACDFVHKKEKEECRQLLQSIDTNQCKVYFILRNCGSMVWNDDLMKSIGVSTRYILHDERTQYSDIEKDSEGDYLPYMDKVIYDLFGIEPVNSIYALPMTWVINKEGQIKWATIQEGKDTHSEPYNLFYSTSPNKYNIPSLDFNKVETQTFIY